MATRAERRGHAGDTARQRDPASSADPRGSKETAGGWVRNSKLGLVCLALFLVFWIAMALTGWQEHNSDQVAHGEAETSFGEYLTTGHFWEASTENWESEFLQMGAFILLTIFFVQKGSPESKRPGGDDVDEDPRDHELDPDAPGPVRHGGLRLLIYENSLLLAFFGLFIASIVLHAMSGAAEHNAESVAHGEAPMSTVRFATTAAFWFQSFQNWQSEFLAVGAIVLLTIVLRQRGSSESKPVAAPHSKTGS
jgi:hypothetical protein